MKRRPVDAWLSAGECRESG